MPEGGTKTRLESFGEDYEPELPEVGYGAHLLDLIFKFDRISYTEIKSWCEITRTPLTGWEAETMLLMRARYESMKKQAAKKGIQAPYSTEEGVVTRTEKQFDALLKAARDNEE